MDASWGRRGCKIHEPLLPWVSDGMIRDPRKAEAIAFAIVADVVITTLLVQTSSSIGGRLAAASFLVALHVVPVLAGLIGTIGIRSRYERLGLRTILLFACFGGILVFLFTEMGRQITRGVLGAGISSDLVSELAPLYQCPAIAAGEIGLVAVWSRLWPRSEPSESHTEGSASRPDQR